MGRWSRLGYVAAVALLSMAATSFGEGYNPYLNHGGYGAPGFSNPYYSNRPVAPTGSGSTIANGGGFGGGFGGVGAPGMGQNNLMYNPYFSPYLNSSPYAGQWNGGFNPWSTYSNPWMNSGWGAYGNPYFGGGYGAGFQSPYQTLPWMYGNGIPGMGYNVGGLGTPGFYDYGMYGGAGYPYLADPYSGMNGGWGYDPYYSGYGLGMGYGWDSNPYDYSYGFGTGYDPYWSSVGAYGNGWDVGAWWN